MFTSSQNWLWKSGLTSWLAIGGAIACLGDSATAQIIPDTTLRSENSTVTSTGSVEQIDGGATRGANLFHSFLEFNVNEGRSALFTNPPEIENILSRVTGRNPSNILGTLGVSGGNANLFLINPNGIIFGPNARLQVGGSFVGTTANAIGLSNGDIFSANPVQPLPTGLLNVNPNAFFFNQIASQPIINRSVANPNRQRVPAGLQVPQGKSVLLVGGDVRLEGGRLLAPGGRVELGGLEGTGTIGLNVNGGDLRLNFLEGVQRANVSLTAGAEVDVRALRGGSIAINAQNLNLIEGSRLLAGMNSKLGSINSQAGDIEINATGAINLSDKSLIENIVEPKARGNAGNINITTGSLSATNSAALSTSTLGQGNAGNVTINARDTVSFDGVDRTESFSSRIYSRARDRAVGNAGNINITTGSLSVTNGAELSASTFVEGDAGNVTINARDTVSFDGVGRGSRGIVISGAYSRVQGNRSVGNGGNVSITTGSLSLRNGAALSTTTNGRGDAGSVTINARDTVSFEWGE